MKGHVPERCRASEPGVGTVKFANLLDATEVGLASEYRPAQQEMPPSGFDGCQCGQDGVEQLSRYCNPPRVDASRRFCERLSPVGRSKMAQTLTDSLRRDRTLALVAWTPARTLPDDSIRTQVNGS
jgi:hypothetical protein